MANNNISNFNKKMEAFARKVEDRIVEVLGAVANEVVAFIEGSREIPIDTGNLQDSTGMGVYRNGRLIKYIPRQVAIEPRTNIYDAPAQDRDYWGTNELMTALEAANNEYSNGIWLVLFSTMPYAVNVDIRTDFFNNAVVDDLVQNVQASLIEMSRVKA